MTTAISEERKDLPEVSKRHLTFPQPRFTEPQPIIDATSDFEEMDRGEGWGIDDEKTYCRTEK
jgi:hypothetical protein